MIIQSKSKQTGGAPNESFPANSFSVTKARRAGRVIMNQLKTSL